MNPNYVGSALRRMLRSRLFCISVGLVFALLVTAGTSFAWLVSSDAKTNEMGVMQYQFGMALIDALPEVPAQKGGTVPNEVNAKNTGDIPAFIRVLVFPTLVAADGVTLLEVQLGDQVELGAPGIGWLNGEDGYYYYLGRLGPGETTANPLFEEVALGENIAEGQNDARLNITVVAESIDGTGSFYRKAWWGTDAVPTAGPRGQVDTALLTILNGEGG